MIFSSRNPALLLVLTSLLTACLGGGNFAPVSDRYNPPERRPEHYQVSQGDTLYSIAWRYGMDYRKLAAANKIGSPYRIYPGQKLRLREAPIPSTSSSKTAQSRPPTGSNSPPADSRQRVQTVTKNTPTKVAKTATSSFSPSKWLWPHNGKLTKGFRASGRAHKGIDLAGKLEEPVIATASGVVVYAGSGLVGYGNLLIVKHSDRYLSAYAHNSRLLVDEGDSVTSGQRIATIGDTGTDSPKLHFEIRRDGKPLDPLKLLPKRR